MDIVFKLRTTQPAAESSLLEDAAAEIERLRAALHEIAFRAMDLAAEGLPYKERKGYAKAGERAISKTKAQQKRSTMMKQERAELTDYYIKVLLTKRGPLKFSDVTPDMVRLKREQMVATRLAQKLEHAAAQQIGKDQSEPVKEHP